MMNDASKTSLRRWADKGSTPLLLLLLIASVVYWGRRVDTRLQVALDRITAVEIRQRDFVIRETHLTEHEAVNLRAEAKHNQVLARLAEINTAVTALETAARVRGLFSPPGSDWRNEP